MILKNKSKNIKINKISVKMLLADKILIDWFWYQPLTFDELFKSPSEDLT